MKNAVNAEKPSFNEVSCQLRYVKKTDLFALTEWRILSFPGKQLRQTSNKMTVLQIVWNSEFAVIENNEVSRCLSLIEEGPWRIEPYMTVI